MSRVEELGRAQVERLRVLVDERSAGDALIAHYTFNHPAARTRVLSYAPGETGPPSGFLTLAWTGMDLFRPLVLPFVRSRPALEALLGEAVAPPQPFILHAPEEQFDWISDLIAIDNLRSHELLRLDPSAYEPVLNVLVVESEVSIGMPRYEIRTASGLHAAAGVSWRGERFAEVYLEADEGASERKMTRSVLSAVVGRVLGESRIPVFRVEKGALSLRTEAFHIGFRPTGVHTGTADALWRPTHETVTEQGP